MVILPPKTTRTSLVGKVISIDEETVALKFEIPGEAYILTQHFLKSYQFPREMDVKIGDMFRVTITTSPGITIHKFEKQ